MKSFKAYAYYDKKSERYDLPFFCHNDIQAKRKFYIDCSVSNESVLYNFTEDFDLYAVAEFHVEDGVFININPIELVLSGKTMLKQIESLKEGE
jgi:hypothetical protein